MEERRRPLDGSHDKVDAVKRIESGFVNDLSGLVIKEPLQRGMYGEERC